MRSGGRGTCPGAAPAPRTTGSAAVCRSPPVQQPSPPARNPDALLFVGGRENGADDRHCSDAHGASRGSAHRPGATTPAGPLPHSRWRNRHDPGRRHDTGSLGHGIGHSGTAARSAPSASLADERWKNRGFTATLPLLCVRTVGGVASVVTSNQARRYALLFGLALLPLFARLVSQARPGHRPVLPGCADHVGPTARIASIGSAANNRGFRSALTRAAQAASDLLSLPFHPSSGVRISSSTAAAADWPGGEMARGSHPKRARSTRQPPTPHRASLPGRTNPNSCTSKSTDVHSAPGVEARTAHAPPHSASRRGGRGESLGQRSTPTQTHPRWRGRETSIVPAGYLGQDSWNGKSRRPQALPPQTARR